MMSPTVRKHGPGSTNIILSLGLGLRVTAVMMPNIQTRCDCINAAVRLEAVAKGDLP